MAILYLQEAWDPFAANGANQGLFRALPMKGRSTGNGARLLPCRLGSDGSSQVHAEHESRGDHTA